MARFTILIGTILALLGVLTYMGTGEKFPTSLIPVIFGLILIGCGMLSRTSDVKRQALWMHVAVTIGLLGFLSTAKSIVDCIRMKTVGLQVRFPVAVEEKAAMSVLLLVFVIACVRSFVEARRTRVAA